MTREQIEKMEAGFEMDMHVACALGCKPVKKPFKKSSVWTCECSHGEHQTNSDADYLGCLKDYSENMNDAWTVVEKLTSINTGLEFTLQFDFSDKEWKAGYIEHCYNECPRWEECATAPTAPLAICRAALLSVI